MELNIFANWSFIWNTVDFRGKCEEISFVSRDKKNVSAYYQIADVLICYLKIELFRGREKFILFLTEKEHMKLTFFTTQNNY